ncbi:MAG: FtsW/RodA/SpoVE family cell cycle protein [Christensenellales bacterium]|jgi:cell division protein FtsW (lipid II flippase)
MSDAMFEILSLSARYVMLGFVALGIFLLLRGMLRERKMEGNRQPNEAWLRLPYVDEDGEDQDEIYDLGKENLLGRDEDCDVVLAGRGVSAEHARLWRKGGRWRVEDLDSRNGTFVDGVRIHKSSPVRDGQVIKIGDTSLIFELDMPERGRVPGMGMVITLAVMLLAVGYAVLALHSETLDVTGIVVGASVALLLVFQYVIIRAFFPGMDRPLMAIYALLIAIGFIAQYRLGSAMALKQLQWYAIGMVAMVLGLVLIRNFDCWKNIKMLWLYLPAGLALLALTLIFGKEQYGSKNWVYIGGVSFQPSELVKLLLVLALAAGMKDRKKWGPIIAVGCFTAGAMVILLVQKDLGSMLLYFLTFICTFYVATSNWLLTLAGLGAGSLGAVASYYLFGHVRVRVAIWQNPWVDVEVSGYQMVQSLTAIASGGLLGLGLYMGSPKSIPAYRTDFIFAAICEEMGLLMGLMIILLFGLLIYRGIKITLRCQDRFLSLLSFGSTAMLAWQSFIIIGGVVKMIPLTGITLPFISYGGNSMLANMGFIGILQAVAIRCDEDERWGVKPAA